MNASDKREPGSAASDDGPSPSADPEPPEPIELRCAAGVRGIDAGWLRVKLAEAVARVGTPVGSIAVTVVDDARMRALNRTYHECSETTDVLAFPRGGPGDPNGADVAVCADVATREAEKRGHGVDVELLLYALHGVLHCAGYEDKTKDGFDAMHAEEDRILRAIGVGPVFAARAATPRDPSGHDGDRAGAAEIVTRGDGVG